MCKDFVNFGSLGHLLSHSFPLTTPLGYIGLFLKNLHFPFKSKFLAGWYGVSMSCVILAVDRFLEMCWPRAASIIFGGKSIYFWLIFPIVYTLITFFQVPFLYSTKKFIFFPDPYFETEGLKGYPTVTFM
jgi:hypothetical protein